MSRALPLVILLGGTVLFVGLIVVLWTRSQGRQATLAEACMADGGEWWMTNSSGPGRCQVAPEHRFNMTAFTSNPGLPGGIATVFHGLPDGGHLEICLPMEAVARAQTETPDHVYRPWIEGNVTVVVQPDCP